MSVADNVVAAEDTFARQPELLQVLGVPVATDQPSETQSHDPALDRLLPPHSPSTVSCAIRHHHRRHSTLHSPGEGQPGPLMPAGDGDGLWLEPVQHAPDSMTDACRFRHELGFP